MRKLFYVVLLLSASCFCVSCEKDDIEGNPSDAIVGLWFNYKDYEEKYDEWYYYDENSDYWRQYYFNIDGTGYEYSEYLNKGTKKDITWNISGRTLNVSYYGGGEKYVIKSLKRNELVLYYADEGFYEYYKRVN